MRFFSPAKINLFFRVLRKREDGYHEIASIMQAIDLCDVLTFSKHPADYLTCTDLTLTCDHSNLIMKALRLFRQYYEFPSVHIHLEKNIPMQSGLGGGSSNAATVLWALNEKIGKRASLEELLKMGSQLGSDVPFFFSTGSAYCTGRGEIIEPVSVASIQGTIVKPLFGLSTPQVYQETNIQELEAIDPLMVRDQFQSNYPLYFNDLENAAQRIEPKLLSFKKRLLGCQFSSVTMTGSGSAFFCLHDSKKNPTIPSDVLSFSFRSIHRDPPSWYKH